jgi:hypothetical protein
MGERGSVTDSVWSVVRFLSKVLDLAIFLRSGVTDVGFVCGAFEFYLCNKVVREAVTLVALFGFFTVPAATALCS